MKLIKNDETASNIEDMICALQEKNLVYNGTFKYFSNQEIVDSSVIFNHPDGWIYSNEGTNAQIAQYDNCCRIVVNNEGKPMSLSQSLHEFPRWQNYLLEKKVTVNVIMNLNKETSIEISLSDGLNESSTVRNIENTDNYLFELQLDISKDAQGLFLTISSSTKSAVIEVCNVYANIGNVAMENLPLMVNGIIGERKQYIATQTAPAEELSLCFKTPYELNKNQSRLDSVLNGRFGKGENNCSLLPDVRGYFSRCWDNGANIDPDAANRKAFPNGELKGDNVGTLQEDEFFEHDHELVFSEGQPITIGEGAPAKGLIPQPHSKTQSSGGNETRPKNFTELYTIKWA
jgi:hypothetical protein